MDILLVFENDPHGIKSKMNEVGIHSIHETGVKASGPTWFEEEGIYIKYSRLAVALVDEDMLADNCDGFALNAATRHSIPIYALIQGDAFDLADRFKERWPDALIFTDTNRILNAIVEFQINNRTGSGLAIKADMYFKAMLYDEALSVCEEYLDYSASMLSELIGFPAVTLIGDTCEILETVVTIHFIRSDYDMMETTLRRLVDTVAGVEVIWGRDKHLYALNLLLTFYSIYSVNSEKAEIIRGQIGERKCFGFTPEESERNTELMIQRVLLFFEKCKRLRTRYEEDRKVKTVDTSENIHRLIAEHVESSILLFNELAKRGAPLGFGECLSTGYERLMEYCRIIGEKELAVRCLDSIASNLKTGFLSPDDDSDEAILNLKCIKAYLGQTQPDSGNFDVFISHRSVDTELATKVYTYLKAKGKEAFLDRVVLPILGDSEYRNSILEAIDNSSHFILVASGTDFFDSKWVKEECNLFCDEKREGRKNGNFIMLFPREICKEIFANNKKNLPIQLRSFEIMAIEDMHEALMKYII